MDHPYIEQHDLVDRYLTGRLSAEERVHFEDHFVDCTQCLDALELARDFKASLATVVAREVSRRAVVAGLWAWLSRPAVRAALLTACLAILVPALWLATGSGRAADPPGPLVNIPTYDLGAVRGEDARVLTSPAGQWLSLVLEVEAPDRFASLRLILDDEAGEEVWRREGVETDARGRVTLTLPPDSLAPGAYRLLLEGVPPKGGAVALAAHRLRISA